MDLGSEFMSLHPLAKDRLARSNSWCTRPCSDWHDMRATLAYWAQMKNLAPFDHKALMWKTTYAQQSRSHSEQAFIPYIKLTACKKYIGTWLDNHVSTKIRPHSPLTAFNQVRKKIHYQWIRSNLLNVQLVECQNRKVKAAQKSQRSNHWCLLTQPEVETSKPGDIPFLSVFIKTFSPRFFLRACFSPHHVQHHVFNIR